MVAIRARGRWSRSEPEGDGCSERCKLTRKRDATGDHLVREGSARVRALFVPFSESGMARRERQSPTDQELILGMCLPTSFATKVYRSGLMYGLDVDCDH